VAEPHLDHFLGQQDMLLQPYLANVERFGENSHVFINGSWSHAFPRLPFHTLTAEELLAHRPGAQQVESCAASDEVELAQRIMHVVERVLGCGTLLYGRVDLVRDEGRLYLMELELTEPVLHLEYADALQHLVEAIIARSWWLEHFPGRETTSSPR
jgi:hypothetical protein